MNLDILTLLITCCQLYSFKYTVEFKILSPKFKKTETHSYVFITQCCGFGYDEGAFLT